MTVDRHDGARKKKWPNDIEPNNSVFLENLLSNKKELYIYKKGTVCQVIYYKKMTITKIKKNMVSFKIQNEIDNEA